MLSELYRAYGERVHSVEVRQWQHWKKSSTKRAPFRPRKSVSCVRHWITSWSNQCHCNRARRKIPGLTAIVTSTWASGSPLRGICSLRMAPTLVKFIWRHGRPELTRPLLSVWKNVKTFSWEAGSDLRLQLQGHARLFGCDCHQASSDPQ